MKCLQGMQPRWFLTDTMISINKYKGSIYSTMMVGQCQSFALTLGISCDMARGMIGRTEKNKAAMDDIANRDITTYRKEEKQLWNNMYTIC